MVMQESLGVAKIWSLVPQTGSLPLYHLIGNLEFLFKKDPVL